ncbi:MAG: STAS/SEC14 domain-containing protein [Rhodobacteraceae bacterium]|nr:STAS/SEC14 domain-containing protein [Paracoccaceae bacterium]
MHPAVTHIQTTDPKVYAFRISGEVDADAMEGIAKVMNEAFDSHPKVRMLLIFDRFDGSSLGASLNFETLKAQFRSLSRIEKYAVVGAPETVDKLIGTAGGWTGIETRTFDLTEEDEAWAFVGAQAREAA